ncbi:MAG: anthranilate phosphoribosyltransferase [Cyclobacteriaceae bacterium]|nr:anthranilate phosphoribosyltransferase [Cyclobacteriaceae bacterium]
MKEILNHLIEYKTLDKQTARGVLTELANGKYNESQMAAFLTVFMMRNITVEELEGFRDAMLDLCLKIDLSGYDAMDLCGTGGDGKDTFNISTLSSFVVAGAGQNVAKHGNNGVSSICGSSNLLASFGYEFSNDESKLKSDLDRSGICFLHAPLFHPAMKNIAPIRRDLGVKTFFNMLGPMVNPSFPDKQIVGVFNLELARLYGYLYQQTTKKFSIVHALDGYDEISLTGAFKSISNQGEEILEPADLGLNVYLESELAGGSTIEESAKIFYSILDGKGTAAQKDAVCANAGFALFTSGNANSPEEGVGLAKESLASGKAMKAFKDLLDKPVVLNMNM